jgi:hypothetical protein
VRRGPRFDWLVSQIKSRSSARSYGVILMAASAAGGPALGHVVRTCVKQVLRSLRSHQDDSGSAALKRNASVLPSTRMSAAKPR